MNLLAIIVLVLAAFIILFAYFSWRSAMKEFHLYDQIDKNNSGVALARHIKQAGRYD